MNYLERARDKLIINLYPHPQGVYLNLISKLLLLLHHIKQRFCLLNVMHVINYLGACARLVRLRWELTSCYKEPSRGVPVEMSRLVDFLLQGTISLAICLMFRWVLQVRGDRKRL